MTKPAAKNVQRSWQQVRDTFADETGIYGLNLVKSELSKVEVVFWILCVLFLGGITARDLANLVNLFMRQDTVTLAHQVVESTIVFDPPPTFGFFHNIDGNAFDFEQLENDTNVEAMIYDFLVELANYSVEESSSTPAMDELLFQLTAAMIQSMLEQESQIPRPPTQTSNATSVGNATESSKSALILKKIERCYNYYREKDANFSTLMRIVASKICENLEFTTVFREWPNEDVVASPCSPNNILLFDHNYIVFKVMNRSIKFGQFSDFLLVTWKANDEADNLRSTTLQTVYFDITGTSMASTEPGDSDATVKTSYTSTNQRIVVSARISASFVKAQEKTSEPCSTTERRYDCKQRCYAQDYVKLCNCWPLLYSISFQRFAGVPECANIIRSIPPSYANSSLTDYMSWCATSDLLQYDDALKRRFRECVPNCNTNAFVTTTDRATLYDTYSSDHYELELNVRSFVYPLFEERLQMNWEDFLSNFGGILGLYLGISFAALIHIPMFGLRILINRCSRSRTLTPRDNEGRHNAFEMLQRDDRVAEFMIRVTQQLEDMQGRLRLLENQKAPTVLAYK